MGSAQLALLLDADAAWAGEVDLHFWDWTLWLSGKQSAGKADLVAAELDKLFVHILGPLGAEQVPLSIDDAVAAYRQARAEPKNVSGAECRATSKPKSSPDTSWADRR